MFKDELRNKVSDDVRQRGVRAFGKFLPREVFVEAAAEAGVKLGKSALSLVQMASRPPE